MSGHDKWTPIKNTPFFFHHHRVTSKLSPNTNLFFEPYHDVSDALQQWRTVPVSLIIGVEAVCKSLASLSINLCALVVSIPCLDPELLTQSAFNVLTAMVGVVVTPLIASVVAGAAFVSLFTRPIGTLFPEAGRAIDDVIYTQAFINQLPYKKFIPSPEPSSFMPYRAAHKLSPRKNLFFTPYKNMNDALQQWKTAPVALVIGAGVACRSLISLGRHLCELAVSIPCLSEEMFWDSQKKALADMQKMTVPLVAVSVAAGSLVSLLTRPIGTFFPKTGRVIDENIATQNIVDNLPRLDR